MNVKQAFILAGGKGERLRPLTDNIPKPLVKVKGKPILEYCIDNLLAYGVTEVIVASGHMHEKIEDYFESAEHHKRGMEISFSVETEPLGTGGALKKAEELLHNRFFMLNGDNIADFDLSAIEKAHNKNGCSATLALQKVNDVSSFGVAKINGKKIIDFVEKPLPENAPSNLANAGCYLIEKKALDLLPKGFNLIEKTLFPALAEKKELGWIEHKGYWFTTDTIERLKNAETRLSSIEHQRR